MSELHALAQKIGVTPDIFELMIDLERKYRFCVGLVEANSWANYFDSEDAFNNFKTKYRLQKRFPVSYVKFNEIQYILEKELSVSSITACKFLSGRRDIELSRGI